MRCLFSLGGYRHFVKLAMKHHSAHGEGLVVGGELDPPMDRVVVLAVVDPSVKSKQQAPPVDLDELHPP
jgi:hypothetical protein